jgi:hypothetical protein
MCCRNVSEYIEGEIPDPRYWEGAQAGAHTGGLLASLKDCVGQERSPGFQFLGCFA